MIQESYYILEYDIVWAYSSSVPLQADVETRQDAAFKGHHAAQFVTVYSIIYEKWIYNCATEQNSLSQLALKYMKLYSK